MENLKLQEHRHKQAKKLSGGTKRKVCDPLSYLRYIFFLKQEVQETDDLVEAISVLR